MVPTMTKIQMLQSSSYLQQVLSLFVINSTLHKL